MSTTTTTTTTTTCDRGDRYGPWNGPNKHDMTYYSKISDNGWLTICLAIWQCELFDSTPAYPTSSSESELVLECWNETAAPLTTSAVVTADDTSSTCTCTPSVVVAVCGLPPPPPPPFRGVVMLPPPASIDIRSGPPRNDDEPPEEQKIEQLRRELAASSPRAGGSHSAVHVTNCKHTTAVHGGQLDKCIC